MIDPNHAEHRDAEPADALPTVVHVTQAFSARLPTQRFLDELAHLDPTPFGDLASQQPFRLIAYRALLRDYPARDRLSLWMHAYDVEVELEVADPTSGGSPMPWLPSAGIGAASPETSTT
jgi:hypothetical protein